MLKPFKQSGGFQAQHTVATLYRNQMRLPCSQEVTSQYVPAGPLRHSASFGRIEKNDRMTPLVGLTINF